MELMDASLRFPTVVFTIGLGIALVYWLFVLLGALDIDLLGGGDASGAAKGLGDVVGAGKGAGDLVGAAKAGGEAVKAGGDGGGLWSALGLGVVPITITVSLILLVGWIGSLLLVEYATPAVGSWLPTVTLPVMLIAAVFVTSLLVRPLAPVFAIREGKSNRDYVGHTCTITTGHVDDGFGQATVEDGGTVLVIPVRCDRPGKLARNDRALIIDFDDARQAYVVEPAADMLAEPKEPAKEHG